MTGRAGRARGVAVFLLLALVGVPGFAAGQVTLRVAAYNIRHGAGMDDRVDLSREAEVLRALLKRKADMYDVSAPELPTTFKLQ